MGLCGLWPSSTSQVLGRGPPFSLFLYCKVRIRFTQVAVSSLTTTHHLNQQILRTYFLLDVVPTDLLKQNFALGIYIHSQDGLRYHRIMSTTKRKNQVHQGQRKTGRAPNKWLGNASQRSHCWTSFSFVFFLRFYLFIFRERGREREREGEKQSMCGFLSHTPYWGPGQQPRHVFWLGIKPATLWFAGRHSIHWATPARAETKF